MAAYYAIISIITLLVWGYDKLRAIAGQWRVPEKGLITLIILGGAFGALAGMLLFRHKTRKTGFWILAGIGCLIHGYILAKWILSAPV